MASNLNAMASSLDWSLLLLDPLLATKKPFLHRIRRHDGTSPKNAATSPRKEPPESSSKSPESSPTSVGAESERSRPLKLGNRSQASSIGPVDG